MATPVTLSGDKELLRALGKLKKSSQSKILRKGMRTGAKTFKDAAEARAPKRTGKLARAMKVRAMKRSRTGPGMMVIAEGNDAKAARKAGKKKKTNASFQGDVFYGAFVELGTKNQPPNPFMRGAFDTNVDKVETQLRDDVRRMADDAWKNP